MEAFLAWIDEGAFAVVAVYFYMTMRELRRMVADGKKEHDEFRRRLEGHDENLKDLFNTTGRIEGKLDALQGTLNAVHSVLIGKPKP